LTPQFLADLDKARSGYHDSWVSANLVKFFSDGLTDPPVYTPEELQKLYVELDKRGYQLMTHSIGVDSARMVLDAYQTTEKINGPRDRRFRMEHADYLNPEDVSRFHQLSVIANMQPGFCCNAGQLGPTKIDTWNSLLKAGATVTFSSDWPCTWPPDPMAAIKETMTREVLREITPHGPVGKRGFRRSSPFWLTRVMRPTRTSRKSLPGRWSQASLRIWPFSRAISSRPPRPMSEQRTSP
jgi:predicted amidohydrolase YtcJ